MCIFHGYKLLQDWVKETGSEISSVTFNLKRSIPDSQRYPVRGIQAGFDIVLPKRSRYLLNKGFRGTVVSRALRALHRGSLEITLTVPLRMMISCSVLRVELRFYIFSIILLREVINGRL